jgi:hypothetical protein
MLEQVVRGENMMSQNSSATLRIGLIGLILLVLAGSASAQFRAGIQGSVTDTQGAAIVGATVTLTNNETNKTQQTTTGDEGFYRFSQLPPGRYTLSAELAGFKKQVLQDIQINAEAVQGQNIALEAGMVSETVTVTDVLAPPLETENSNIDRALTTQEVRRLPQFGRDPYELSRLAPGVFGEGGRGSNGNSAALPNTAGPGGSSSSIFQTENQVQIVSNGQRLSNNNFQIDGVSVNSLGFGGAAVITPNQESVKEIRVLSSSYSAEHGRNSGAQVLVVSQNGTNNFHGSAFLKYDSPKLNAFNKYGGPGGNPTLPSLPPLRVENLQRQFGGSFGGPLPLPHFGEGGPIIRSGKDKLFFFVSYEGLRQSVNNTVRSYVETPQYRQLIQSLRAGGKSASVLSSAGITPRIVGLLPTDCGIYNNNPALCRVVAGGLDIGSPTGALNQYVSLDTPTGGGFDGIPDIQFALIGLPGQTRGNQFNGRIDYNLNTNNTFALSTYFSRLNSFNSDADAQGRPMADLSFKPFNSSVTFTYNRIISATTLNEVRFNVTRFADDQVQDTAATTNFGIPRIEVEALPIGGRIRFGARREETTPAIFAQNTYEFSDTLNKVFGSHGTKFGAVVRREQDNNSLVGGARPVYSFSGLFNLANDTPIFEGINVDPVTGGPADAQRYFRTNYYAFFGQDDWKARPNLTINFGLRYEYFTPISEKRGRLSNLVFDPNNGLTGAKVVVTNRLFEPDRNNFGPRVGFAYSPKYLGLSEKAVIRGGFGVFYNRIPDVLFSNTRGNPPNFARLGICCGTTPTSFSSPFAGGQILYALGANSSVFSYPANPVLAQGIDPATGAPRGASASVEIYGAPPREPNSYVYSYSLETQYQLPAKMVATVGYQGSSGHKLIRLVNQKFLYQSPANTPFSAIFFPQPDVTSSNNALNLELTRQFSQGLQFQANYRFSKSLDELSYEGPSANTNQTFPQDLGEERGPSDFDATHYLTISGLYDLPFFNKPQSLAGKVLGGFELSGILTAHSGFPWTPKTGQNSVSTPGGPTLSPIRPFQYFGGAVKNPSNRDFINGIFPGSFGTLSNGQPGYTRYFNITTPTTPDKRPGIGRNSFRGPRYFDVDMALAKRFGLPHGLGFDDSSNFEFRVNVFNIFNTLNLAPFNFFDAGTFIENPNFGRANSALAGRVVELQGRFRF